MTSKLLDKYVELIQMKKKLDEALDKIKPDVVEEIKNNGSQVVSYKDEEYSISIQTKDSWEFSADIKEREIDLKAEMDKEKLNGKASKIVGNPYPVCKKK